MDAESIRREALSLSPQERAELAEHSLTSLEALPDTEIEHLWLSEAERRAQELDQGLAKRYSAEEVEQQAKALLR
jgi:hypothetical protein